MHFKIGLEPKWYMGAFQQVQEVIIKLVNKEGWSNAVRKRVVLIILKLINGFAVVAHEVRKLAEQSKQSVEHITELIQTSTTLTNQAVGTTTDIKNIVHLALEGSTQTQNKFNHIFSSMDQNNRQINQVKVDMKKLVEVIQQIGKDTLKVATTAGNLYSTTSDL